MDACTAPGNPINCSPELATRVDGDATQSAPPIAPEMSDAEMMNAERRKAAEDNQLQQILMTLGLMGGTPELPQLQGKSPFIKALNYVHGRGDFTYDMLKQRHLVNGEELTDEVVREWRASYAANTGDDCGQVAMADALQTLCERQKTNPLVNWLIALDWDGVPRLDTWLIDYAGAEDTPLNRAIGRKFPIGAVRRALYPGCQFDSVLTLQGAQGAGKSSLCRAIAGSDDLFTDVDVSHLDAKAQGEMLQGVWIAEMGELSGIKRAKDIESVKAFITRRVDRYREAYARFAQDRPRACVFVATTNADKFLIDATGGRRFWPVRVGRIDVRGFAAVREQIFAEAVEAVTACHEPAVLPESLWSTAAMATEARRIEDPWLAPLEALEGATLMHRGQKTAFVGDEEPWGTVGVPRERRGTGNAARIDELMTRLGWKQDRVKINGETRRGYVRPV